MRSAPRSLNVTMLRLNERHRQPEIMDHPALSAAEHVAALRGLSRLNFAGNNPGLIWSVLKDLSGKSGDTMRVLDIATGGGDVPLALAKRAHKAGLRMEFAGCDISPLAIDYARSRAAAAGARVEYFEHNVLDQPLPAGYDACICSLFLHHLSWEQAVGLLRRMADASGRLIVVSDLNRTPASMLMTLAASYLLTRSKVVHVDGPRSVQAAFNLQEATQLAHAAGLTDFHLRAAFPCRFLLTWRR